MPTLTTTTTVLTGAARVVGAMLDSPPVARRDPRANVLASLRADGWRPVAVRLGAAAYATLGSRAATRPG